MKSIKRSTYSAWRAKAHKDASGLNALRKAYRSCQQPEPFRKPRGLYVTKIGDLKMIAATVDLLAKWWNEDTKAKKPMPKMIAAFLWCVVALDTAIMNRRGPFVVKGFKV